MRSGVQRIQHTLHPGQPSRVDLAGIAARGKPLQAPVLDATARQHAATCHVTRDASSVACHLTPLRGLMGAADDEFRRRGEHLGARPERFQRLHGLLLQLT